MARLLAGLYLVLLLALVAGAVGIFRLRCESFGCMGLGVAWLAWAGAFGVTAAVGLLARWQVGVKEPGRVGRLGRLCEGALRAQCVGGAVLLAYWAARTVA